jgi:hypothetical protein
MNWNQIVNKIRPYIVKIETPAGSGSGFLCLYNENKSLCGIATASHVVEYAGEWQQLIKIIYQPSKEVFFLKEGDRVIFPDPKTDSTMILFHPTKTLPDELIRLRPAEQILDVGSEVG